MIFVPHEESTNDSRRLFLRFPDPYFGYHFFVYHFWIPQLLFKHFWLILLPSTNPGYYLGKEHPPYPPHHLQKKQGTATRSPWLKSNGAFAVFFVQGLRKELIEKTKNNSLSILGGGDRPAGWSLRFAQRIYKVGPW